MKGAADLGCNVGGRDFIGWVFRIDDVGFYVVEAGSEVGEVRRGGLGVLGGDSTLEVEGAGLDEFDEVGKGSELRGEKEDGQVIIRDQTLGGSGELATDGVE